MQDIIFTCQNIIRWSVQDGSGNDVFGVSLDIENYCTLRLFFGLVDLN
ncbi:hypothetical protein H001_04776 [Escherichia coli UMEA 3955-1]|nr:hypothetical protein H001_04776 [Escherichia coli UMEA 3955-1]